LASALLTGDDHVGLEEHPLERDALFEESGEHRVQDDAGKLLAALDRMRAVHQHFRLDDRHKVLFLTERSVPSKGVRVRTDAGDARQRVGNVDNRPPLREAGAHVVILREAVAEPVEPFGHCFAGKAGERPRTGISLDPRKDALIRENLGEWRAAGAPLTDGLILQDDPLMNSNAPGAVKSISR
jgi:hypothetical protein